MRRLYFWIYRPHCLLSKYYYVCLFDDHGVDDCKTVSMTQWSTDNQTLIVHGASEIDEKDNYITIMRVPKLGCLECKQMRDDDVDGSVYIYYVFIYALSYLLNEL